jgi:hypothetical protein
MCFRIRFYLITLILGYNIFSIDLHAYEPLEGQISSSFGFNVNKTEVPSNTVSYSPKYETGLGFIALGDIDSNSSLEMSMFYMPKVYFANRANETLFENTRVLQVNMGYRRWWTANWSSSISIYSSYPVGPINRNFESLTTNSNLKTSASEPVHYGYDLAIQRQLDFFSQSFSIDIRYSTSINNKPGELADHVAFFFGWQKIIQEK